jgi:hypothetical protein
MKSYGVTSYKFATQSMLDRIYGIYRISFAEFHSVDYATRGLLRSVLTAEFAEEQRFAEGRYARIATQSFLTGLASLSISDD